MAVLSIGQVWADEEVAYTLTVSSTGGNSSPHNSYTAAATPTINGIEWSVLGNSNQSPWRLGGKESNCSGVDRDVHSNTAISDNISKIEITHGTASNITVNSMTVVVSKNSDFSDPVSTLTPEFVASDVVTVNRPAGKDWSNCYYKFVYNLSVSGNSNRFVQFSGAVFYKESGSTPTCATPTFDPEDGETFSDDIDVEIASATDGATIYYTTDGEDPTTSSDVYTTALNFTETTTLKAMAVKEGSNNSAVATATYTKVVPFAGSILEITKDDFVASYASNNGEHEKDGVTYYTNQVCLSSSSIQFQKSNGLLYNKTDLGEIAKIEITKTGDNNLLVYSGTTENPTTGEVTGSASGSVTTYTFASGKGFFAIKCNSTALSQVTPIKIYYVYSAPAVVAPTISGETPFSTSTTVSITHADADHIYYTTNGVDPTTSSTEYTVPFTVDADGTTIVKAIAVKGGDVSAVASKEFEKVASYTTLADIFTKATEVGNTATDIYVTFGGWKVSAKTNNNVFLTDGTNGAVIYGSGHGFNAGDVLTGTAACKVQLYKGFAELTSLNSSTSGLTVTPGSVGDPVVKTWDQLSAVNTGALVKLENLTYNGTSLSDGENTIPTYTTFYSASFENGKKYNLTGVYQYYNTNGQILPRSAADVQEIIETFTVTYNNAPDHGTLTIKNGDEVVTSGSAVNEGTVLTIVTNPAEGYKLVGVTVNGSAYTETTLELTEDVTIAATFEENLAPLVTSYILSEIGVETSHLNGEHVGDKVNLPLTAASCSKVFRGWDADPDCDHAPTYAPGAEITLAANNEFYAVYADAHVVTPTDHALGSGTFNGTNEGGNTASEGYEFSKSTKGDNKAGYIQDSGTKDATIVFLQIKAESQIINEEPSAIIVTAHLGAGSDKDPLDYPVYAVLVDADDNNVGDPVVLTTAIPKDGDDFSVELPTANYADVRGVKISHMKEDGWNVRYYSMSFKYQTGGTTYDNYSTDCQAQVATPVIAGVEADGVYSEGKEISITCATAGATIYYAVDSDDEPTTEYTGAFTVDTDGAHTVKAKAVKTDMVASEIASVSFTINLPLSTMDQIFVAATAAGNTATDANIAFNNWVVSGVSTNGKNVFVTDGTKGFIIFDNGGEMGFAVGDVLSGTAACKVQLYKGAAELTTLSSATEGLNIAKEGVITPAVKAISALSGINTGAPVTINSVQFDGEYLTDGVNSIKPFNSLSAYAALEDGKYYNVTGIYQQFDATKEILPRSAADIEEVNLEDPELSYTPTSATIEIGQDLPATVFANPHDLAISYNSNNEAVATVSNTGVIALGTETGTAVITASFAGNATYAAANVTYTITVNPASVTENVVILAVYDTKYYAMSTTNASSAFTAIEVEYDGSKVTVNSEADKAAIQWTKKTSGDNTTFQDANSKYMKSADGTSMSLQDAVCNWVWDESGYYKISGTTRTFFYQSGTGFKNFATSNFNKSGYSDKAQVIVIDPANIVITSKVSAELAYDPESDEITQGDAWSAPSLVNPHSVTITSYASDNESVATVTDGGVIALAGGTGTAVITAHFDGDASYLEGDAVYTIMVNAPAPVPTGTSYVKVTSTADITADGEYLLVNETALKAFNGDLATLDAEGNTVNVVISEGKIAGTSAIDAAIFTIDATTGDLRSHSGHYVGVGSYSNGMTQSDVAGTYANVFAINASDNVDITITFAGGDMHLLYNTGGRFRYYKAENSTNKAIQLYKKETSTPSYADVRTGLTAGNYYTICYNKTMTAVQGATLWEFAGKDASFAYIKPAVAPYPAGKPYIVYATSETLEATLEGDAVDKTAIVANGALHGTFEKLYQADLNAAGENIYLIIGNELRRVDGQTGNTLPAYRAYIDLDEIGDAPAHMPANVRKMPFQKDVATGMDALDASDKPVKMVINGQLFILRGEKLYDATGRLVK